VWSQWNVNLQSVFIISSRLQYYSSSLSISSLARTHSNITTILSLSNLSSSTLQNNHYPNQTQIIIHHEVNSKKKKINKKTNRYNLFFTSFPFTIPSLLLHACIILWSPLSFCITSQSPAFQYCYLCVVTQFFSWNHTNQKNIEKTTIINTKRTILAQRNYVQSWVRRRGERERKRTMNNEEKQKQKKKATNSTRLF